MAKNTPGPKAKAPVTAATPEPKATTAEKGKQIAQPKAKDKNADDDIVMLDDHQLNDDGASNLGMGKGKGRQSVKKSTVKNNKRWDRLREDDPVGFQKARDDNTFRTV